MDERFGGLYENMVQLHNRFSDQAHVETYLFWNQNSGSVQVYYFQGIAFAIANPIL